MFCFHIDLSVKLNLKELSIKSKQFKFVDVLQKFKIGEIPILLQIVRDTAGNPLEANSDQLLNKINYNFNEDVGIGDIPESFASDKDHMYGADDYKGVVWRIAQNGLEILSVLYECNAFFTSKLKAYRKSLNTGYHPNGSSIYTGDPTVYGGFDANTNKYIIALEEINRYNSQGYITFHQDPVTLSFNEVSNAQGGKDESSNTEGFESKLSYHHEGFVCLDVTSFAFINGQLWKFSEDAIYCNFFGVQYDAYITAVFNESGLEKKSWLALTELSSDVWECPEITTNVFSYGKTNQSSKLITQNFKSLESDWHANFLRDQNTNGGLYAGGFLKGNYIIVKFIKQNASQLIYINGASVFYKDSPLTNSR